jgi:hypothetical protein
MTQVSNRRAPVLRNVCLWFSFLCLAGASAAGAGEDRFILRANLVGSGCPSELVIVEAVGCDSETMADELVDELVAAGFDRTDGFATACQSAGGEDEYICWYCPSTCQLESSSITIEAGDDCSSFEGITGRDFGSEIGCHFFSIDRTYI